jgi:hypothetical protein
LLLPAWKRKKLVDGRPSPTMTVEGRLVPCELSITTKLAELRRKSGGLKI